MMQIPSLVPGSQRAPRVPGAKRNVKRRISCGAAQDETEQKLTPAQAAIQERIKRAQQYKVDKGASPKQAEPVFEQPGQASSSGAQLDQYNSKLAAYGAQVAEGQRQELAEAMQDLGTEPASGAAATRQEWEALQSAQRKEPSGPTPSLHAKLKSAAAQQQDTFSQQRSSNQGPMAGPTAEDEERRAAAMSGSDSEAASYLQEALKTGTSEAAELRPEMFTLLKEEEAKARGVEFITKDKDYNPLLQPSGDSEYKPKVATWGMFPRPPNISKAYGGGRTYRPGDALETPEAARERQDKTAAAVLEYRKRQGLYMEPEEEERWTRELDRGRQLMQTGQLQAATQVFEALLTEVPLRSSLGGEVQLQRAICLDSEGRNEEAYKAYMVLERHSAVEVRKRAKRMLFGFRAAENLKANTMSYSVGARGSQEWEKYFLRMSGEWNSGYVGDSEDQTLATVLAVAVLAMPLMLVAFVAISRA